jgi:hypothetical protein
MDLCIAMHECQLWSVFILFISEKYVILLDGRKIVKSMSIPQTEGVDPDARAAGQVASPFRKA